MTSRSLATTFLLLFSCSGCTPDDSAQARLAELSSGCLVNSDCAAPLVCAFQRCHVECVTTRDCDGTLRCVGAHQPARVCQLESEATCQTSADCAPSLVCSGDGACRDTCQSDDECIGDQLCTRGVCAEPDELDESGKLPQISERGTCLLNSDCPEGQRCLSGACLAQCREDRDCSANEVCDAGACRPEPDECQGQPCDCACRADIDCNAGETCDGCTCRPAPAPECSSGLDCATGQQCVDGACRCACVVDRDCESGFSCDGCGCQATPPSRTVHDATVRDASDIALMQGIDNVETRLYLTGLELTDTRGLEGLRSVGSLDILNAPSLAATAENPSPLAGLSGLQVIRGDLRISNANVDALAFAPELRIQGNVNISATGLSCTTAGAFEQTLRAHGFAGIFNARSSGGCNAACVAGSCEQP